MRNENNSPNMQNAIRGMSELQPTSPGYDLIGDPGDNPWVILRRMDVYILYQALPDTFEHSPRHFIHLVYPLRYTD